MQTSRKLTSAILALFALVVMSASALAADPGNVALQTAAANALTAYEAAATAVDTANANLDAARAVRDNAIAANYPIEMAGDNIQLLNVAPDEGLSASFNSWFTLFGQFFDHGLDLVAKGGSGTVFIPLQPDDPLYVEGSPTNFMVLTRATVTADGEPINTTTPFVDQNQTYTSHPSHQVFLREYVLTADGPKATGELIQGENGGMATWADVKAQAKNILGIELKDTDVGNIPLLRTDPYGNFIPDPVTGFPHDAVPAVSVVFPGFTWSLRTRKRRGAG